MKYYWLLEKVIGFAFLTHFSLMFYFYTPWKRQKTKSIPMFSGGIKKEYLAKIG